MSWWFEKEEEKLYITCRVCGGAGSYDEECEECCGSDRYGEILRSNGSYQTCYSCNGKGTHNKTCSNCDGTGQYEV